MKLLPVTVKVKSAPPAGTEEGASVIATGLAVKLLALAMPLVNKSTAVLGAAAASGRNANPFAPHRTNCVPETLVLLKAVMDSEAVSANDAWSNATMLVAS
jgi:hypothetical protein